MITALDTNVLLDIFADNQAWRDRSLDAVRRADAGGSLVICEIVFAELSQLFSDLPSLKSLLAKLEVRVEPVGEQGCFLAGQIFHRYRQTGGKRDRVLADFLVAAHAKTRCGRLLTRDRGYYRTYFPKLEIIEPA